MRAGVPVDIQLALDHRAEQFRLLAADRRREQGLLLRALQHLGRRHLRRVDKDLEQRHEERTIDRLAPLVLHFERDPRIAGRLHALGELVAALVEVAGVDRAWLHGEGRQGVDVARQDRRVGDELAYAQVRLRHFVERTNIGERHLRRRAAIDLARRGRVARDGVGHGAEAADRKLRRSLDRDVERRDVHAAERARAALDVFVRHGDMQELERAIRFLLDPLADRFGQTLAPTLVGRARRQFVAPEHRVDEALRVLRNEGFGERDRVVADATVTGVFNEHDTGAESSKLQKDFLDLRGEVGVGRVARGEHEGANVFVETPHAEARQAFVDGREPVPVLCTRDEKAFKRRGETLQRERRRRVVDELVAARALDGLVDEVVVARQDLHADHVPLPLELSALGLHVLLAVDQLLGRAHVSLHSAVAQIATIKIRNPNTHIAVRATSRNSRALASSSPRSILS